MPLARLAATHVISFSLLLSISSAPALAGEAPILYLGSLMHDEADHRIDLAFHHDISHPNDEQFSAKNFPWKKRWARSSRMHLGVGQFDGLDRNRRSAFNVEFRDGRTAFFLSPAVGILANTDGGFYGYAAVYSKLSIGPFRLIPEFAMGAYLQGSSKDLGGAFAFREALQLAYQTDGGIELGLQIAHISNASIYEHNPGQEDLHVTVSVPLDDLH